MMLVLHVVASVDISKCTLEDEVLDCSGVVAGTEGFSGEILLPLSKIIFNHIETLNLIEDVRGFSPGVTWFFTNSYDDLCEEIDDKQSVVVNGQECRSTKVSYKFILPFH